MILRNIRPDAVPRPGGWRRRRNREPQRGLPATDRLGVFPADVSLVEVEGVAEGVVPEPTGAAVVPPDPGHEPPAPLPELRELLRLCVEPRRR